MHSNNHTKILLLFGFCLIFFGCSTTKHLPEDVFLLDNVKVTVNDKKDENEEVMSQLYQLPNGKVLGFPLRLQIYNLAKPHPKEDYLKWLERNPRTTSFLEHVLSKKQVLRIF